MADQPNPPLAQPAEPAMDEIEQLMAFDPFALKEGDPKPEPTSTPASPPEAQSPAPAPVAAPPAVDPATPQTPTQPAPTPVDALAPVVTQLEGIAQRMAQQPSPADPKKDDLPSYEFDIPDPLVNALASENPAERKVAIAHLVKGVGRAVHQQMREDFAKAMPAVVTHYLRQHEAQRQIFDDFYGAHKDLNRPELRQDVVTAAGLLAGQPGFAGWNPAFRDRVAAYVRQLRNLPAPGAAPLAPSAPPAPAPTQPHVFTPGARPAAPSADTQQQAMLELLAFA